MLKGFRKKITCLKFLKFEVILLWIVPGKWSVSIYKNKKNNHICSTNILVNF